MGLLDQTESFATQIPWWPLISILGTFSAGKSTFINNYLDTKLQRSGNQAVDDRFTVICYSEDPTPHTLPGVSLDSDPRFLSTRSVVRSNWSPQVKETALMPICS